MKYIRKFVPWGKKSLEVWRYSYWVLPYLLVLEQRRSEHSHLCFLEAYFNTQLAESSSGSKTDLKYKSNLMVWLIKSIPREHCPGIKPAKKHVIFICLNNLCLAHSLEYLHSQIQAWKLSIILSSSLAVFIIQSYSTDSFLLYPWLFIIFGKFGGETPVISVRNLNKMYQALFTTTF